MNHFFPGSGGLILATVTFATFGVAAYFTKKYETYDWDPRAKPGAFEPFLARYIRVAEFIIGLATGSIVLLIGSSALHGLNGRLPWFYASPLLLLACSVVFGIGFMVRLIYNYEMHQHGNPYTRFAYSLTQTLGFTALACFCFGYCPTLPKPLTY